MNKASKILSDITVHMKYAKYLPDQKRRETWDELITRNMEMHILKYPKLESEIRSMYQYVYDKKVLPSMRSLQFAGKSIEISPNRIYNCAYTPIDDVKTFSEVMFLLLGGVGVGISVQSHHIEKISEIRKPSTTKSKRYLIGDSIEGWADAIDVLLKSYTTGGSRVRFDFSDIRAKGARLVTSGGKAPGPQPLKECLLKIEGILDLKSDGDKLTSLECYDIVCHIADSVLAGGIRRAAILTIFSADDDDMMSCKSGNWYELNPQRGRSNNSAMLMRHKITKDYFSDIFGRIKKSGCGEPGIVLSNDKDLGYNPCVEISLRPNSFCNLVEVNVSDVIDQIEYENRVRAAAFLGTLQAGYTDFHYLRSVWKKTTEKDALLGVSMTGVANEIFLSLNHTSAANVVKSENVIVAKKIGINSALRTTCIKPAGTTSLVLGTSSGIHAWHGKYYIRRIRIAKNEALYQYLSLYHPELLEDEYFRPHDTAVINIPVKAPDGAILRNESAMELLERVKKMYNEWVKPGHIKGSNTHNISATINIKDDEWDGVCEWMWDNRNSYNGLSILPHDGGTYIQAPFEECDEIKYDELMKTLIDVDLSRVIEMSDMTDLSGEAACAGGSCEIK